ncbi:ATP synthase F1 subunit gamma [Emergencia timonensis]|uniref:ATP synthase F1 subunit gamma n=1 Tax=Emergencia timonensis TaxID=1776384 RepID=UPI003994936B
MAEQMQNIQRRIKSIGSTERITNAMKLVSAAKLRKAKSAFESSRLYLGRLLESIQETLDDVEDVPQRFLAGSRDVKNKCYVLITSSNGLCGSFNGNVIRTMTERLSEYGNDYSNVRMVTIGSKGREYFAHHGVEILMEHDAPADTVTFEETKEISRPLMELYAKGEIDEIDIVYTSYINTLKQEVIIKKLLPIDIHSKGEAGDYTNPIEYGPSAEAVFSYLIPKYIELMIFSTCIESATCEYAARRTAMENANDNAKDILADLQLEYNHARQSAITDEIIEIVAGAEAQR